MTNQSPISVHFLADLDAVCPKADDGNLSSTFLEDLEIAYAGIVFGWGSGIVALAEIKIPLPERLEDDVPCEPLIAQVQEVFASFTAEEIKAIAALGSKGG